MRATICRDIDGHGITITITITITIVERDRGECQAREGAFPLGKVAEARLAGLERFREVIVDFTGVTGVGQGFADEVSRVWPAAHPETRVVAANMRPTVAFMVGRAGGIVAGPNG